MNNVYAKNLKQIIEEAETKKLPATFFATGKTEQGYITTLLSGVKFLLVNASYEAVVLKQNLEALNERVIIFPETAKVLTENFAFEDAQVLKALIEIDEAYVLNKNLTVIFTPNSICGIVPKKEIINNNFVEFKLSFTMDINKVVLNLKQLGFVNVDNVIEPNEFSLKGDILTIYDSLKNQLFRISFFGDEVEEIAILNKTDFSRTEKLNNVKFVGQKFFVDVSENDLDVAYNNFKIISLKSDALLTYKNTFLKLKEIILNNVTPIYVLPLVNKSSSIIEYFNNYKINIILIEPKRFSQSFSEVNKSNLTTFNSLLNSGLVTRAHKQNFVSELFNLFKNTNYNFISFQSLLSSNQFFKSENFLSLDCLHQTLTNGLTLSIKNQIKTYVDCNFEIKIVCQNEFLKNVIKREIDESITGEKQNIEFFVGNLSSSLIIESEKLAIFGFKGIIDVENALKRKQINVESFKEGDYVVHSVHGIGKFCGIVKKTVFKVEKDFIEISYAQNSKLFVPCENCDMISKYSGQTPKLSVMGGKDFEKQKNKVRQSVKQLAFNLAKLYASRRERKGFKFVKDDELQQEFEHRFSFVETPGQLEAINDVKRDMESSKIMDRLICGDVGFGKTEVAIRAAFKAILSGKQVCVLAPTTVLALQHFKTFKSRMDAYQINVVLLCRFVKGQEEKQNLNHIKSGKAQVVIGTHRVLSDDVEFFDLGLFIVDEEQRFGTGQKEKIKNIKQNVDSLTLSATPLPRTLHLSLINVRDISVIDTPPKNRIPVQLFVCEFNFDLIISAINNEVNRGGQVLIIYNNVEKVEQFALLLKNKLPEVNVDFGHAKLSSTVLEDKILNLYNNQTQVFVSTTIVENGIDLPNANTLVVIDADRFGLSQLYQIKGRVGRSTTQAYAYFLTDQQKTISEDANKRLTALMEFSNLGSGIEIAKKDLEIRGAGNIFGAEQSGHMDRIGYVEYVKILDEEVKKASGQVVIETVNTVVETDVNMFVDYTYAPSTQVRTQIYKNLSEVQSELELKDYLKVLKNKFGEVPQSVKNIGEICLIKNLASKNLKADKVIYKSQKTAIVIAKQNFNLTNEFYKKLCELGFVLVFNNKSIINNNLNNSSESVFIELKQNVKQNEKLFKLKQIVS